MEGIRIYVEGGGMGETRRWLRKSFGDFLSELGSLAKERCMGWNIIACGTRRNALDHFLQALKTHPDSYNILLVDSEAAVTANPISHLKQRDRWDIPDNVNVNQCHLMVQMMESWFIADQNALVEFYGQDFNTKHIPAQYDVESIDKSVVEEWLRTATRPTQKGEYDKTKHGPKILSSLDPSLVRSRAKHCDRLFSTIRKRL